MAAGAATLELLTPAALTELNARSDLLRRDLVTAFAEAAIPVQVTGLGSLFGLHLTDQPVRSYRDTLAGNPELRHQMFLGLFNEGLLIDPRGVGTLSTAIGHDELRRFAAGLRSVLARIRED
jgi:glutamate-1-semialdehyde 2,1-aminomutase